jgi:hypothetical protein
MAAHSSSRFCDVHRLPGFSRSWEVKAVYADPERALHPDRILVALHFEHRRVQYFFVRMQLEPSISTRY